MSEAEKILKIIKEAIDEHPEIGQLTPTLYDPDKLQQKPGVGILVETPEGWRKRFQINVIDHG
jgi:hypothetical protein